MAARRTGLVPRLKCLHHAAIEAGRDQVLPFRSKRTTLKRIVTYWTSNCLMLKSLDSTSHAAFVISNLGSLTTTKIENTSLIGPCDNADV